MRLQRLAAAAAATALAASLVACSDSDRADDASPTDQAPSSTTSPGADVQSSDATSSAAAKVGKKARKKKAAAFPDATEKLSAGDQAKVRSLDRVGLGAKGQLAGDSDAVTVALYFGARQAMAADTGMDRTALEAVSAGTALREATVYVSAHMDEKIPFSVDVISSKAGTLHACVGPDADDARTLTVQGGKVVTDVAGDHHC
jgi:hypothetical protein